MTSILHKKSNMAYITIILIGLQIIALSFIYYGLHLGIKPCKGLSTDASNCGDADMGGVVFVLIGAPFILFGILCLTINLFIGYLKRRR